MAIGVGGELRVSECTLRVAVRPSVREKRRDELECSPDLPHALRWRAAPTATAAPTPTPPLAMLPIRKRVNVCVLNERTPAG